MEKEVELERIKSMVLAKCEQLCPHDGDRYVLDNCLTIMNFDGWDLRNKYGGRGFPEFTIRIHKSIDALSSTWFIAYRLLGLEADVKGAEIDRLKKTVAAWEPVSAPVAINSLKLANQEAEISRLRGMLEAVVSHAKEPAMSDELFRQFAIENCEYTLKGGE